MGAISIIRLVVLGSTMIFSIVELAIAAHFTSLTQQYLSATATFCSLGLAVGAISLVTLPVMLIVDFIRRGAFTSMIIVELVWLSILSVLWVGTAGETVSEYDRFFPFGCIYRNTIVNGLCQETQAIEAFSFLNFIILLLYAIVLVVMGVIAASRGQDVWFSSVKVAFDSPGGETQHPMTQSHTGAPVQSPGATQGSPGIVV